MRAWTGEFGMSARWDLETMTARAQRLRRAGTAAERLLWGALRGRRSDGVRFRRQHIVDNMIVDLFCSQARLVIEIDGGFHCSAKRTRCDRERGAFLQARGLRVMRFTNDEVLSDLSGVLQRIEEAVWVGRVKTWTAANEADGELLVSLPMSEVDDSGRSG